MVDRNEENLSRIDRALDNLAREDAPERLVQSTLQQVRSARAAKPQPTRHGDRRWASGLAAVVVAFAAGTLVYQQLPVEIPGTEEPTLFGSADAKNGPETNPEVAGGKDRATEAELARLLSSISRSTGESREQARPSDGYADLDAVGGRVDDKPAAAAVPPSPAVPKLSLDPVYRGPAPAEEQVAPAFGDRFRSGSGNSDSRESVLSEIMVSTGPKGDVGGFGSFAGNEVGQYAMANSWRAEDFLTRFQSRDGLVYQQPTGYWANDYLPGDPGMRMLEAQLRAQYPQALRTTLQRNAQPFDAPENSALGVYLHATRSAVDGPARLQLQVGLRAAERQGGVRPPMNVAVVLDLPETVDVSTAQQIRALLIAMNDQRQTGDRFSVTVAGSAGGSAVSPDEYRHGTVVSFIDHLANGKLQGPRLDLVDAFVSAVDHLAADDDPNAVLGSSLVVLVTADGIDAQTHDDLVRLAHRSAVAGMPVSMVTLAGVAGPGLQEIALAGQGRMRALGTPGEAAPLIDRELHSASQTVARAIRLRVQLDSTVRLVDVIGSRRLDEAGAERVREAEQSIDARLSRTWGIQADRGDDEDGIQIVIPYLAAGESHVVLLDVVVSGPGAVADVQVRYKDLVQMNNGLARASLSLADAGTARHPAGPLELNVLKNLLAAEIAAAARRSSQLLERGEVPAARAELAGALTLVSGLRQQVAGWENDVELKADERSLNRFLRKLDAGDGNRLAAELAYAAYRKLLPPSFAEDQ